MPRKRLFSLRSKKVVKPLHLYSFPNIKGLEDIAHNLNSKPAESLFGALLHGFELQPIIEETSAQKAERMIEYLERAFDIGMPLQVESYHHILCLLLKEYDDARYIQASKELSPSEFLKALLTEERILQKDLVPDCFRTSSQVSEFLNQKKSRKKLNYQQALALGRKFKVNPLNFLE